VREEAGVELMNEAGRVPASRFILFWAIALGGTAFDLTTKSYIFDRFAGVGAHSLIPDILEIRLSQNAGALWGFGRGVPEAPLVFAALSLLAAVAILWWLFGKGAARDARYVVALGLIMAGALGNCYDRLRFGFVRDFVHFHVDAIGFDCAIFNFADNMLILGAVGLLLLALRPEPAVTEATEPTKVGPPAVPVD
jgi:signal peptidase II